MGLKSQVRCDRSAVEGLEWQRGLTGLLVSRGVWARPGCGKLEVQRVLGEGLVGSSLEQSRVCVKCLCRGAVRCLQPAPAPLRGRNPTPARQLEKQEGSGAQMSSEGRGSPSSLSEPPALLTHTHTRNILSWTHEDHRACSLELCSGLLKLLPLAQTKNFRR